MLTDLLDRLDKVNKREEDPRFYYIWHARLFNALIAMILLCIVVWGAVLFFAMSRPEALTWAQTAEGKTVPLYSVEEPQYSTVSIENWVESVVKTTYNYDFAKYNEQFSAARLNFSPEAWVLFEAQFKKNVLPELEKKQMLVSVATDKAKVSATGLVGGIRSWKVEVPITVSYVTASETKSERVNLEVMVKRQVSYTNPKGLWITQLIETKIR